ncbi:MAG: tetratricopeptide repeat protein [bacterium]|nr:tetratricopeptide repeat protein [bacterium]
METIDEQIARGLEHLRAGRLDAADQEFTQLAARAPQQAHLHYLLGMTKTRRGIVGEAIHCLQSAATRAPQVVDYQLALASVLAANKQMEAAIRVDRQALVQHPNSAELWMHLGQLEHDCGRFVQAIEAWNQALELKPDQPDVLRSLGLAHLKVPNGMVYAVSYLERAASAQPTVESFNELGYALKLSGDSARAAAAFEKARKLDPNHTFVLNNLSTAYKSLGRLSAAVEASRRAVDLDPEFAVGLCNLGIALSASGLTLQAEQALRRCLECKPNYAKAHSNLLFNAQYLPEVTAEKLFHLHREYDKLQVPRVQRLSPHAQKHSPHQPLVVGFLSDGLGRHPVGYFIEGLLGNLDANRVQVICYSDRHREDDLSARLRSHVRDWRTVIGFNNQSLAEVISRDSIDILFDLCGHAGGNRMPVFAKRPAPVQITWMGYVGTTGLSTMDYLLADRFHVPVEEEQWYTERILRMPHDYICYTAPAYAPEVTPLPAAETGQVTFGCFNQPAKINTSLLDVWSRILKKVANSRLLLIYSGYDDPGVRQRILDFFESQDVDRNRIEMHGKLPHPELMAAYGRVDLALDSFPYSGGLTTCEALWMGVPVVTKTGRTFAGRHSTSHLSNLGLTNFVCSDAESYIRRVISLTTAPFQELRELRPRLREIMAQSPLCDGIRFASDWTYLLTSLVESRSCVFAP